MQEFAIVSQIAIAIAIVIALAIALAITTCLLRLDTQLTSPLE
jgi:hypothetical protein